MDSMQNSKSYMDKMKNHAKKTGEKMAHGMEDMKNKSKKTMHKMEDKVKAKTSEIRNKRK